MPLPDAATSGRAIVIGCGALARELLEVAGRIPGLEIACLPPGLHNRPEGIPGAVRRRIADARADGFEQIFVAYADCGTGGLLDPVLAAEGVERLPGAHCYEVFAGSDAFAAMADAEPGTFWLTDFLARNFDRLVIRGLGIDRHPELQATYFAHYERVVYLSQTDDPELLALARRAADRLGLAFEHRPTGVAHLAAPILAFASGAGARGATPSGATPSGATPSGRASPGGADSRRAGLSDEVRVGVAHSARGARAIGTKTSSSARAARGARIPSTPPAEHVAQSRGARIPGALNRGQGTR